MQVEQANFVQYQGRNDASNNAQLQPLLDQRIEVNNEVERINRQFRVLAVLDLLVGLQRQEQQINNNELYRLNEDERMRLESGDCPVCMWSYQDDQLESLISLPCNDSHIFHENCIIPWLNHNHSCPLCRKIVTQEALNKFRNNAAAH